VKNSALAGCVVAVALLVGASVGGSAWGGVPDDPATAEMVPASPELVRQVQFMLQTLGIDPGPIDGNAQALTNRAIHQFELQNGLPIADLVTGGPISSAVVDLLRKQAMVKLGSGVTPPPAPTNAVPPPAQTAAIPPPAPAPPALPPPDPFASCPSNAEDFKIGGKQYTAQSFLDEGFGGSVDRAVPDLRQRLVEARDIAEKIGGNALLEVQRQARVLAYFECRQKVEQASAAPK